ncbi:MAG TPA: hypothetical protein VJN43_16575 [Bryobacteraceae bacterium]|nr:hypothetical protein [Bryobacteraceae bacterium]
MLDRIRHWRACLEETHSAAFELRRHFFLRFFDSELVSTPGQMRVVAAGVLAILLSSSLLFVQAYWHKYIALDQMPTPEPYRLALLADVLFLITFSMFVIAMFTTLQWPALFPGLRDYLALAGLPVRMREVFVAKFTALVAFAGSFVIATTLPPSLILPMMIGGRYSTHPTMQVPALFASCSLAALFVFFSLVAVQGVLLNLLPHRQFVRISLAIQGALLTALLCGFPLVLSISSLQNSMNQRPEWAVYVPPAWFLGLDQVIYGNHEPFAQRLAWVGLTSVAVAAAAAVLTYLWSYRRHRVRVLESRDTSARADQRSWRTGIAARFLPDPRKLAVFSFIGKTLVRSRHHRLVLTAFAALAIAVVVSSFEGLVLDGGFREVLKRSAAVRQAAISAPLALSLFLLAGFRYLFRLPVELPANWVFRVNEAGNRLAFLTATEQFLLCCAVAPVALVTLPLEMLLLGVSTGIAAGILCLVPSLILMEILLVRFEKVPFTSSYLPGRRPPVETVVIYGTAVMLYISILGSIINWAMRGKRSTLGVLVALLAVWWKVRRDRREDREIGKLEFEELPEPAIQTLSIQRD